MKVKITEIGLLELIAENELEYFALESWLKLFKSGEGYGLEIVPFQIGLGEIYEKNPIRGNHKKTNFNKDILDQNKEIIPSDKIVLQLLNLSKKALTVKSITEDIEGKRDVTIKRAHIGNSLIRLLRNKQVNKYVSKGKENEWRIGWGVVVNMDVDEFIKDNKSSSSIKKKPQRKIKKISKKAVTTVKHKLKNDEMLYASGLDRINFAKKLGFRTIDEAICEIGSWDFEKKLKAHLTNIKLK